MKLLALSILLATAVGAEAEEKESRLFRALGWATFASKGADVITTEYGLAQGGYEANPVMRERWVRGATVVAVPALVNWSTSSIYKEHPKLALWLRIACVAGWSAAAVNNAR